MYDLEYRQALEESLNAIELARRSDDSLSEAYARHTAAHALCLLGEVEDALSQAEAALELAERGYVVDLYEQDAELIARASRWNEGKIHLGFVYAKGQSRTSASSREGARFVEVRISPAGYQLA